MKRFLGVLFALALALILSTLMFSGNVYAAPSTNLVSNGDFSSNDLSSWTVFITSNGITNEGVVSFDTNGDSTATPSARFNVGQHFFNFGVHEGGGIYQAVNAPVGEWEASVDIAAVGIFGLNAEGGRFELIVDGVVEDDYTVGFISVGETIRSTLSASGVFTTAGSHEIRIKITRPWVTVITITPFQYVDNVVLEMTLIPVDIDIKPGSFPNSINPNGKGVILVAILGSATFDVTTVDVTTLDFEGASSAHDLTDPSVYADHLQDVNGDGYTDLVSHYQTQDTGITKGDTSATLTGDTIGGIPITGTDSIRTVGR